MSELTSFQILRNLCAEINRSSPMQTLLKGKNSQDFEQVKRHAYNVSELRPSGPREKDVGTEQIQQGIMHAQLAPDGSVVFKLTLLAAGFIVGGKGASIQKICEQSGARSKSWFQKIKGCGNLRVFFIEGSTQAVLHAIQIIIEAVDRYNELIQGKYQDQVVKEIQIVGGIAFQYKPPPIHTIPVAARTKHFSGAPPSVYGAQKVARLYSQRISNSSEESGRTSKRSDFQGSCNNDYFQLPEDHISINEAKIEQNYSIEFDTQEDQTDASFCNSSAEHSGPYLQPLTTTYQQFMLPPTSNSFLPPPPPPPPPPLPLPPPSYYSAYHPLPVAYGIPVPTGFSQPYLHTHFWNFQQLRNQFNLYDTCMQYNLDY